MAWSEPPFIVFVTLFLIFFSLYVQKEKIGYLILSALLAALSSLTRYVGIAFALSGLIYIIFINRRDIKMVLKDLICFSSISLTPLAILLISNYLRYRTFTGYRNQVSPHTYAENFQAMSNSIYYWFFPDGPNTNNLLIVGLILVIGIIVGIYVINFWKKEKSNLTKKSDIIIFILGYLFLLLMLTPTYYDPIDDRLLSPIAIPLYVLLMISILEATKIFKERFKQERIDLVLLTLLVFFIIYSLPNFHSTLSNHAREGKGYTSYTWKESETINFLQEELPECSIFTNAVDVIFFYTGISAQYLPLSKMGSEVIATIDSLRNEWPPEEEVCLVWFDNIPRDYFFTPEELLLITDVKDEVKLSDGSFYFLLERVP